ncbi:hypothetical protein IDG88_00780 [Pelagibacterales bacterium SAG-MED03]|nr:hypothetical protein [Pelagibacterales bacterium SAG-MED03]|tara:strand:- start:740 stop:1342 length:603 start_codon:yes stop_codon:yes gene_type:complete
MSNSEILKLFPEPVFKYKLENFKDLNKQLLEYIYKLYNKDKEGVERSNKGGWHSKNFTIKDSDSIQHKFAVEVQKYILDSFQKLGWKTKDQNIQIKEMWAIINKKDDFNVIHTHPNCYLSAAYYVKASKGCGRFQVENPNIAKRYAYPEIAIQNELNVEVAGINISEGDLLIFPSYLPHKVKKNESDEDRIVISFNVSVK